MSRTIAELAELVGGTVRGDGSLCIDSVATLAGAGEGQISFLANPRYRKQLDSSRASAVIIAPAEARNWDGNAIIVADPYLAYAKIATILSERTRHPSGIHPHASVNSAAEIHSSAYIGSHVVVEEGAVIGAGACIGPGCVIGRHVEIGADSTLVANVTINEGCQLGERALIHPGVVIGSDGFGLANDEGRWVKVPQLGRVILGKDVEVGANTTIDRGAIEDTIIEDGVKLDNLIQVAHNVHIGENTAIAACTGIAGSTRIGKNCAIAGGVGILGHLEIVDGVTVTAMSLVTRSIKRPGVYSSGTPLEENRHWHRNYARFKQLDDMARRIKELEKIVAAKGS